MLETRPPVKRFLAYYGTAILVGGIVMTTMVMAGGQIAPQRSVIAVLILYPLGILYGAPTAVVFALLLQRIARSAPLLRWVATGAGLAPALLYGAAGVFWLFTRVANLHPAVSMVVTIAFTPIAELFSFAALVSKFIPGVIRFVVASALTGALTALALHRVARGDATR